MPVTENNTPAGNVTEFGALGNGAYFQRVQDQQLYVKLDSSTAKKCDDDAQNYTLDSDAAVIAVAAERVTISFDP